MAEIYDFGTGFGLATQAQLAKGRKQFVEAERLQRKVVQQSMKKFGTTHIVTAAALLNLAQILEANSNVHDARLLRCHIRRILDTLEADAYPTASGQ